MKTFFPKHFSYTQEFTKLKTLISISILAHETEISVLAKRKLTSIIAKKYLFPADSQLVWGVMFFFFLKSIRFVKSTGPYSLETGASRCYRAVVQSNSSIMLSSLTSADCQHLENSHWNGTTAFSSQKFILTDVIRRSFLIIHLPLCYLSWQTVDKFVCGEILWEVQLISGLVYASYQTSQRLLHFCAKNNYTYKLGNGEEKPTHDFQTPKLNSVNGPNCSRW